MTGAAFVDIHDWKLLRDIERLHPHGARVTYEILVELGCSLLIRSEVDAIVNRYADRFCAGKR